MAYKTELQSNNADLQTILNTISTLPEGGGSSKRLEIILTEVPASSGNYVADHTFEEIYTAYLSNTEVTVEWQGLITYPCFVAESVMRFTNIDSAYTVAIAVTPENVWSLEYNGWLASNIHAASHATDGSDPIAPESIGAIPQNWIYIYPEDENKQTNIYVTPREGGYIGVNYTSDGGVVYDEAQLCGGALGIVRGGSRENLHARYIGLDEDGDLALRHELLEMPAGSGNWIEVPVGQGNGEVITSKIYHEGYSPIFYATYNETSFDEIEAAMERGQMIIVKEEVIDEEFTSVFYYYFNGRLISPNAPTTFYEFRTLSGVIISIDSEYGWYKPENS